jgi:hypothetical protein
MLGVAPTMYTGPDERLTLAIDGGVGAAFTVNDGEIALPMHVTPSAVPVMVWFAPATVNVTDAEPETPLMAMLTGTVPAKEVLVRLTVAGVDGAAVSVTVTSTLSPALNGPGLASVTLETDGRPGPPQGASVVAEFLGVGVTISKSAALLSVS